MHACFLSACDDHQQRPSIVLCITQNKAMPFSMRESSEHPTLPIVTVKYHINVSRQVSNMASLCLSTVVKMSWQSFENCVSVYGVAKGEYVLGFWPVMGALTVDMACVQGTARERFNEIQQELSQLSTKFSNNLLDATKAFKKLLKDPAEVFFWLLTALLPSALPLTALLRTALLLTALLIFALLLAALLLQLALKPQLRKRCRRWSMLDQVSCACTHEGLI